MEKNEEQSFVHRDILHHPFKNDSKLLDGAIAVQLKMQTPVQD